MELVVDTNVLFSFFKKDSTTRELITNFEVLHLYTPKFCVKELKKHQETISEKANLTTGEFKETLQYLETFIQQIPLKDYEENLKKAKETTPDPDDIDFFALALKLGLPIWTNDKKLEKQNQVKIHSTEDIIQKTGY